MITDKIKESIANHIEASLNILSYGCNVEGRDYEMFSEMFVDIGRGTMTGAEQMFGLVRSVSEATDYSSNSVDVVRLNKTLVCETLVGDKGLEMCKEVIRINECLIEDFNVILGQAEEEKQHALAQYCTGRINGLNETNHRLRVITK